jgi:hypothetical protein
MSASYPHGSWAALPATYRHALLECPDREAFNELTAKEATRPVRDKIRQELSSKVKSQQKSSKTRRSGRDSPPERT